MMPRTSRGCIPCRRRHVGCDEARPSCTRCVKRNEVCQGYRDEATMIFRHETEKVTSRMQALSSSTLRSSTTTSIDGNSDSRSLPSKAKNDITSRSEESRATDEILWRYLNTANDHFSSVAFLQHLPCMFEEANIPGRYALRFAVQAASLADVGQAHHNEHMKTRALECYGLCLSALAKSLRMPGKIPDDYDLMSIVILDLFEVCVDSPTRKAYSPTASQFTCQSMRQAMLTLRVWHRF